MEQRIIGVCYPAVDAPKRARIDEAAKRLGCTVKYISETTAPDAWWADCEIIFGSIKPKELPAATSLKWLQLHSAGADAYCRPGMLREDVLLTNASGGYGIGIAEYGLCQLLALLKRVPEYWELQKAQRWEKLGSVGSVYGSLITVIGLGDIGKAFALRVNAMGATVRGVKRTLSEKPDYVESLYTTAQLDAALEGADVVFMALPNTPETTGIMSRERLFSLKPGAVLINVGRGTSVDQAALIDALKQGHLGGAALDVTVPEPLPADDPLWSAPNLLLTPHVSGGTSFPLHAERIVDLFIRNLEDYIAGRPFARQVDRRLGY